MNIRAQLPVRNVQRAVSDGFEPEVRKIAILAFEGFSLTSLSSFLSPFRSFNAIREKDIFRWTLASECGRAARSDLGIDMPVQFRFSDVALNLSLAMKFDMLVLVADSPTTPSAISPELGGSGASCLPGIGNGLRPECRKVVRQGDFARVGPEFGMDEIGNGHFPLRKKNWHEQRRKSED
jgi:hypothetical protein